MPGGWTDSNRKASLPSNWAQLVAHIKRRAGGQCEWTKASTGRRCTNPGRDVDHQVRPADGGTDDPSNLWLLCHWHHARKTSQEGAQAKAMKAANLHRRKPNHPGIT